MNDVQFAAMEDHLASCITSFWILLW